jgi:hypothetical protein
MSSIQEKKLKDQVYQYLKANLGTAYTLRALTELLKPAIFDNNKEEGSTTILKILNSMKNEEKIDSVAYNGTLHYFYLKIFDYEQYKLNKTHFIVPDNFISSGKTALTPTEKAIKKTKIALWAMITILLLGGILMIAGFMLWEINFQLGLTLLIIGILIYFCIWGSFTGCFRGGNNCFCSQSQTLPYQNP